MNRAERRELGVPKTVAANIMLREEAGIEIKYC